MADKGSSSLFGNIGDSDIVIPEVEEPESNYFSPKIFGKADVLFALRRWWDIYLNNTKHENVSNVLRQLAGKWRDPREHQNFIKSYSELQKIRKNFAVVNKITDLIDLIGIMAPKVVVAYNLLSVEAPQNIEQCLRLTRIYRNITGDSLYSHLPHIRHSVEALETKPKIIIVTPSANKSYSIFDKLRIHIDSAEEQVMKKLSKRKEPLFEIVSHMGLDEIVSFVNEMLYRQNGNGNYKR